MSCQECDRLKSLVLESFVFADRAQSAARCHLFTNLQMSGVSNLDQYLALHQAELRAVQQRHQAYLLLVQHQNSHGAAKVNQELPANTVVK